MIKFVKGGPAYKAKKYVTRKAVGAVGWTARKVGVRGGIIVGGSIVGAATRAKQATPGLKRSASYEGAIEGAVLGGALAFSPTIAKGVGKEIGVMSKKAVRSATVKGKRKVKGFFRRNGRVIPIFGK